MCTDNLEKMDCNNKAAYEICFSPTGGTKKISTFLINGLSGKSVNIFVRQQDDFSGYLPFR